MKLCNSRLKQKTPDLCGLRLLPEDTNLPESVNGLTANRGEQSIVHSKLPRQSKPDSSQTRCELMGAVIPERQYSDGTHNLLAMVRQLSQAGHKHSLKRDAQDVRGVWADTSRRLLRGSHNQSSAVVPLAIKRYLYESLPCNGSLVVGA